MPAVPRRIERLAAIDALDQGYQPDLGAELRVAKVK
jgi:hypothetical protein